MLEDFLSPIDLEDIVDGLQFNPNQWGSKLRIHQEDDMPDLMGMQIALIGVEEDRNRDDASIGCQAAPNAVRRQLYQLYNWEKNFKIVDLGNIRSGKTRKDTCFAVRRLVRYLLDDNIIPVLIGGTHDISYGQFLGHGGTDNMVNVVVFDEKIDLFSTEDDLDPESFLYRMLMKKSFLFNFAHVGYQRYLVDPMMLDTLEKLHFECYSLGEIRNNMEEVEPIIRNAHMISFDISAIRYAEAPGTDYATPNGFRGEEACRVARYAGLSDHVSSFGVYQYNPQFDHRNQTAKLLAQMIWYFADGFYSRKYDHPELDERDCLKYIVNFSDNDHEIQFLKSRKSDRWWMNIPVMHKGNLRGHQLIPCSYADYELACRDEIPDRWMKSYLRLAD